MPCVKQKRGIIDVWPQSKANYDTILWVRKMVRIGFIGFGNMATAMAKGFIQAGADVEIAACAKHYDALKNRCESLHVFASETVAECISRSDLIIIAIKPHLIESVIGSVRTLLASKMVVSVAAGWTYDRYESILHDCHHVSMIPNLPVCIGKGVMVTEKKHSLTDKQYTVFESLFSSLGHIEWIDTSLLSVAGTVAGCGPAFVSMFIESLADAGVKYGLPRKTAYALASSMLEGTAAYQRALDLHPGVLKDGVCSPGGTTIKGICALEENGFRHAVISAIDAIEGQD